MSHGNISLKISDIQKSNDEESNDTVAQEAAALEAFLKFFCPPSDQDTWADKVARGLAQAALLRLNEGKPRTLFNSANVAQLAGRDVAPEDATRWLSRVWDKLEGQLSDREVGMQDTARMSGLSVYAWPRKIAGTGGAGKSSAFGMELLPLPEVAEPLPEVPPGGLAYVRDLTLKPAFWLKPVIATGFKLQGWRRAAFIGYGIGGIAVVGCASLLLWSVLATYFAALSYRDIAALVILSGLVAWAGYVVLRPFWRLIELRIIMAPDALLSIRERGVQLEAAKEAAEDGSSVRVIRLVRYAGHCPICGELVHLQDGRAEFRGRLVGRCEEHPAEHVFSFDRHTKVGKPLR